MKLSFRISVFRSILFDSLHKKPTMDNAIVNEILRMSFDQQTCLFEVKQISDNCLRKQLCKNPKQVLASINNFTEIFKISRDGNRIELQMPVGRISFQSFFSNFLFLSTKQNSSKFAETFVPKIVRIFTFVTIIFIKTLVVDRRTVRIHTVLTKNNIETF